MFRLSEIKDSFLHLLFPHVCAGCGSDLLSEQSLLCMRCINNMPDTHFEWYPTNPVEKIFWGRLGLTAATAQFYFTRESLIQHLMHQFKYKSNKELGKQLGKMMGAQLQRSGRFDADVLIPIPLFPEKERRRGYNQATVLCEGMAESMHIPVLDNVVIRTQHTETQTMKGRVERWKNMEGKFIVNDYEAIHNKHLLLVDDVITTGATLEACGYELMKEGNIQLSIATLCVASR